MAYKFIVRQEMPKFYIGNPNFPVMNACIEFLRDIHAEDDTYESPPPFEERLQEFPYYLSMKGIEVAEKEMYTNPTLVGSTLRGAFSVIVNSDLAYASGICWLGNLVPEDMMDDFYQWAEKKEQMSREMISRRASDPTLN